MLLCNDNTQPELGGLNHVVHILIMTKTTKPLVNYTQNTIFSHATLQFYFILVFYILLLN